MPVARRGGEYRSPSHDVGRQVKRQTTEPSHGDLQQQLGAFASLPGAATETMLFGAPASQQLALSGTAAAPLYGGGEQAGGWPSSSGHSTPPLDMVRV